MQSTHQFGFGLELASELQVPGAVPLPSPTLSPDISIALGASGPTEPDPGFSCDGDAILYRNPVGNFRCLADLIEITPGEPLDREDLGALLIANALPAVLWMRSAFMLHAACVRLDDGACVAIAGPSGSGKSRLAAHLVEAGAQLIADDSAALTLVDDRVHAAGLSGGWFARSPGAVHRSFRAVPGALPVPTVALDVLVILGGQSESLRNPLAGFEALMQHRHRPQVPQLLGRQAEVIRQAAAIAKHLKLGALPDCTGSDEELTEAAASVHHLARERGYVRRAGSLDTGASAD